MSSAQEFKAFIMRGNVVDLAVGMVVGTAFSGIVKSLVGLPSTGKFSADIRPS